MNIALTGGTGFIGSHFLKQALAAGHSVLALRRSLLSKPRIPIDQQPEWLDRQLDEVTAAELQGCDVLVHLAAHTGNVPYDTLANCLRWNLMAALALFEQARLAGVHRFVVAGSCFEYGHSGEQFHLIPTTAPLQPTNAYAASKAATSISLLQWAEEHGLSIDVLRVFHAFGEGELPSRLWPKLRNAANSGEDFKATAGDQIRDFMAVQDVANVFLQRALIPPALTQYASILNLSSSQPLSLRSFSTYWWNTWEAKGKLHFGAIPYRTGEVMRYAAGPKLLIVPDTTGWLKLASEHQIR